MSEKFEIARFRDEESAADLGKALSAAGIACAISSTAPSFDIAAVGRGTASGDYLVIVRGEEDELRARRAMLEGDRELVDMTGVAQDYYLRELAEDELKNVVKHPREWSAYDVAAAEVLLKERGEPFQPAEFASLTPDSPERAAKSKIMSEGKWLLAIFICLLLWRLARSAWGA